MRRFLSITFAIVAIATFLQPTNASAATAYNMCDAENVTFDLGAAIDTQVANAGWPDWREHGWVFVSRSDLPGRILVFLQHPDTYASGGMEWMVYDDDPISVGFEGRLLGWSVDGYFYGSNGNAAYGGGYDGSYYSCLYGYGNLRLSDSYTGPVTLPPTEGGGGVTDPDNDHTPQCEPWDIACWFGNVVGNVVDGFQGLADTIVGAFQALGDWMANLIMPSNAEGGFDNRFIGFFTDVQETMTERLGFLLFPFQFISDLVASFTTIYNPYGVDAGCTAGSQFAIPNLLGNNGVTLDLCKIEDTPVWEPASTLLRFVWIVGLVGLLHRKYMSTVRA